VGPLRRLFWWVPRQGCSRKGRRAIACVMQQFCRCERYLAHGVFVSPLLYPAPPPAAIHSGGALKLPVMAAVLLSCGQSIAASFSGAHCPNSCCCRLSSPRSSHAAPVVAIAVRSRLGSASTAGGFAQWQMVVKARTIHSPRIRQKSPNSSVALCSRAASGPAGSTDCTGDH